MLSVEKKCGEVMIYIGKTLIASDIYADDLCIYFTKPNVKQLKLIIFDPKMSLMKRV
jgi:hypothetical protein